MNISIKFEEAKILNAGNIVEDGMYLALKLSTYDEKFRAKKFVVEMLKKAYEATIKVFRNERTSASNRYCWKLCAAIAEKLQIENPKISRVSVYRKAVEEIGIFEEYSMVEDAFETFEQAWTDKHIGRFCLKMDESRTPDGRINVAAFLGSSNYNTREMYILIQLLRQECAALKIEYRTPREVEEMLALLESEA